jgi:hypothetical protein
MPITLSTRLIPKNFYVSVGFSNICYAVAGKIIKRILSGISTLPKLKSENDQTGIRIASPYIPDQLQFLHCMLVGMMMRTSRTIAKQFDRAIVALARASGKHTGNTYCI